MVRKRQDKQLEVYYNKLYRKRRVRFYTLLVVVATLIVSLGGLMYIKSLPIDMAEVANKETVQQVMAEEYGAGYVKKLKDISELKYDSYYSNLKHEYDSELEGKSRPKDLDKKALEIAFFVEFVTAKAIKKAETLGYQEYSRDYYQGYKDTVEAEGNEKVLFDRLIEEHHKEEIDGEAIGTIMAAYEDLVGKGYVYLTSISISDGE